MNNNQIQQNNEIEFASDIKLTPEQTAALTEWIISQTTGTFSADADDDKPKQALTILISAMCYEEDSTEREYILYDVRRTIFKYSHAFDMAEEEFLKNGFRDFSTGKWKPETDEATAPATEQETVSEPKTSTVASWLSEQLSSPNKAVRKLAGDLLTELETGDIQNSPEYIEMVLENQPAPGGKVSDAQPNGDFVVVADQILNPIIKKP